MKIALITFYISQVFYKCVFYCGCSCSCCWAATHLGLDFLSLYDECQCPVVLRLGVPLSRPRVLLSLHVRSTFVSWLIRMNDRYCPQGVSPDYLPRYFNVVHS